MDNSQKMKKKYQKPELIKLPSFIRGGYWMGSPHAGKGIDQTKPVEIKFSKELKQEIRFNPTELPESVRVDHPRCPLCGSSPLSLVGYAVGGGDSLSKNKCTSCGHVWGPGE